MAIDRDTTSDHTVYGPHLSLIFLVGIVLCFPMLYYGPLPSGHDSVEHLAWYKEFSKQFWSGDPYPRWVAGLNGGFGSPIFFVYGPLPYFVATLLRPVVNPALGFLHGFPEFNVAASMAMVLSGITAYLWLRTMVGSTPALAGAVLYMAMPYHLWADLYVRCAIPECWAFVWVPMLLYFTARTPEGHGWLGIAASYALLTMTHLFTTLIFTPIPFLTGVVQAQPGRRLKTLGKVTVGVILGIALSAIYLIPAISYEKYIPAVRLTEEPQFYYANNFVDRWLRLAVVHGRTWETDAGVAATTRVPPSKFRPAGSWLMRGFKLGIVCSAVTEMAMVIVGGVVVLAGRRGGSRKRICMWLTVCFGSCFMMLSWSRPLWEAFPLLQKIQFPFRFQILLCVGATAVLALAIDEIARPLRGWSLFSLAIGSIILAGWTAEAWTRYQGTYIDREVDLRDSADKLRGVWARWTDAQLLGGTELSEMSRKTPQAKMEPGTVSIVEWQPRAIVLRSDSVQGGWVQIRQFYFPGWEAKDAADGTVLEIEPSKPEGMIRVRAQPGRHEIRVQFPVSGAERIGGWLSAVTLVFWVVMLVFRLRGWPSFQRQIPARAQMLDTQGRLASRSRSDR
ncbi:MAG: 6-pyruvoyl-tetrahydropterin synthase-related protein [Candidatus Binatia bacterium]